LIPSFISGFFVACIYLLNILSDEVFVLFLHDGGIYVFISASGADVYLLWPRELIKGTSAKAPSERENKKTNIFKKNTRFSTKPSEFFFLVCTYFLLCQIL
jgi:hypothetical protein